MRFLMEEAEVPLILEHLVDLVEVVVAARILTGPLVAVVAIQVAQVQALIQRLHTHLPMELAVVAPMTSMVQAITRPLIPHKDYQDTIMQQDMPLLHISPSLPN